MPFHHGHSMKVIGKWSKFKSEFVRMHVCILPSQVVTLQCAGNRRNEMAAVGLVEGRAPWNHGVCTSWFIVHALMGSACAYCEAQLAFSSSHMQAHANPCSQPLLSLGHETPGGIGNSLWTGVLLADVLAAAGVDVAGMRQQLHAGSTAGGGTLQCPRHLVMQVGKEMGFTLS